MTVTQFIKDVDKAFRSQTGSSVDAFKLGATAFSKLQAEVGDLSDENWVEFPNDTFSVELRSIGVDRVIIEWGDGSSPFECLVGGIDSGLITPQGAISDWSAQTRLPKLPFASNYPYSYNPSPQSLSQLQYPAVYPTHSATPDPMDLFLSNIGNKSKTACSHDWKRYQGLSKVDYTCSKCNERRDSIA
jgi:hypothetical protein